MPYVFTFLVVSFLGFLGYRMIKDKSVPSNNYTPDDDITFGRIIDVKQDSPIHDSKHNVEYAEYKVIDEKNEIILNNDSQKNT